MEGASQYCARVSGETEADRDEAVAVGLDWSGIDRATAARREARVQPYTWHSRSFASQLGVLDPYFAYKNISILRL